MNDKLEDILGNALVFVLTSLAVIAMVGQSTLNRFTKYIPKIL